MASEIRVNKINNRVGLGTVTYTDTGIIVSGISPATNFKTGSSNLHSTGLNVGDTFVHSTGINGSSADIDDFISVGSNIHLGNAGVVTATNYVGTINTPAQPNITSVGTLSSLNVSGNVSIAGTLTYEDVTNVDSVGVVTARTGVVTPNVDVDDFISVGSNIHLGNAGIITATSFIDDGTNLLTAINTKATTGKAIAMAMIFG